MTAEEIIFKYYPEDNALRRLLLHHSHQVADMALAVADRHPELHLDRDFPTIWIFSKRPHRPSREGRCNEHQTITLNLYTTLCLSSEDVAIFRDQHFQRMSAFGDVALNDAQKAFVGLSVNKNFEVHEVAQVFVVERHIQMMRMYILSALMRQSNPKK